MSPAQPSKLIRLAVRASAQSHDATLDWTSVETNLRSRTQPALQPHIDWSTGEVYSLVSVAAVAIAPELDVRPRLFSGGAADLAQSDPGRQELPASSDNPLTRTTPMALGEELPRRSVSVPARRDPSLHGDRILGTRQRTMILIKLCDGCYM